MQNMKRWLCRLLAVLMLFSAIPAFSGSLAENAADTWLTMEQLTELTGGSEGIHMHQGAVTLVEGTCTDSPVRSPEDAARVVRSMTALMGGDERTDFTYLRTLTDGAGNLYYVFKQMYNNTVVLKGAVKVITSPEGEMLGFSCSVEQDLPEEAEARGIDAAEAEERVRQEYAGQGKEAPALIAGGTVKMILPVALSINIDDDNLAEGRFVWAVYSENPDSSVALGNDLPYLAHYVAMNGDYLYSLPTILPGDEAASSGFDAAYAFEFMEPAEYTGYVDLVDGTEKAITVTLMRDRRTGMYYLGNIERRILVADCYEFLYNGGRVVAEYSPDNREWDQVGLLSLYNYCRVWDYYNAIGWQGGDGVGTPMLVLNNFCDRNHAQMNNACYVGKALGWQVFIASQMNDFSQALDVIAHEFTHCVTGTVMTYNWYANDYGAINEAISDIQGNTCEHMMDGSEDDEWLLGEKSGTIVRSMGDPHRYTQPEYVWDLYYTETVRTPTQINDQGGVHRNSSLLNRLAWQLIVKNGMTLEDSRDFWFAVDCAMVPGTDYLQLSELLPWVLKILKMDRYAPAMAEAIEATRINTRERPGTMGSRQSELILNLPETDTFSDGNWMLNILSFDAEECTRRIAEIGVKLALGDDAGVPKILARLLKTDPSDKDSSLVTRLLSVLITDNEAEKITAADLQELLLFIRSFVRETFYFDSGKPGEDGHTIHMMTRPGKTIPFLLHMTVSDSDSRPRNLAAAALLKGRWYDLSSLVGGPFMETADQKEDSSGPNPLLKDETLAAILQMAVESWNETKNPVDFLNLISFEIPDGTVLEIPAEELSRIQVKESLLNITSKHKEREPRKTRPVETAEDTGSGAEKGE